MTPSPLPLLPLLAGCTVLLAPGARADIYMHHPRGSNNKLFEQSNNVNNANRLFDSQNNGNGGYQVCDNCPDGPCHVSNEDRTYDKDMEGAAKGEMYYYEGSHLQVEWTQQHGCGKGNRNTHCEVVLQYACEDTMPGLRDGHTTAKPGGNQNQNNARDDEQYQSYPDSTKVDDPLHGRHESYDFYMRCRARHRNLGLFVANQLNPNNNNQKTAVFTRQRNNGGNNNNGRFGFECPEERDYYPYWHPSPWRDLAVLTTDAKRCGYYQHESQNYVDKGECVTDPPYLCENFEHCRKQQYNDGNNNNQPQDYQFPNNPKACKDFPTLEPSVKSTKWTQRANYGISRLDFQGNNLDCGAAPWGRTNHLGSTSGGWAPAYDLTVPNNALNAPQRWHGLADPERCESDASPFDLVVKAVSDKVGDAGGGETLLTLEGMRDCASVEHVKQLIEDQRGTQRYRQHLCKTGDPALCGGGGDVSKPSAGLGRGGGLTQAQAATLPAGTKQARGAARGTLASHGVGSGTGATTTTLYLYEQPLSAGLRCVLRVRYNISSGDFDGWNTFSKDNEGGFIGTKGDPAADFLGLGSGKSGPLELSVNPAQFFRVFEDRSHVFRIKPWPGQVMYSVSAIHNFNVRGRRGNIVQVYPAVEYDFVSRGLEGSQGTVSQFDYLHIQWCGSDANPQGNAGNGRQATDRSNLVQTSGRSQNKPMGVTYEWESGGDVERHWDHWRSMFPSEAVTAKLAFLGQDKDKCDFDEDNENDVSNCMYLNSAPAYFDAGLVQMQRMGEFHLMSTRNNAFTNRAQKTTMTVGVNSVVAALIAAAVGVLLLLAAGAAFLFALPKYMGQHPNSCWAGTCCGRRAVVLHRKRLREQARKEAAALAEADARTDEEHYPQAAQKDAAGGDGAVAVAARDPKSAQKAWSPWDEWWAYEGKRVKWVAALVLANVLMAVYGFLKARYEKPLYPIAFPFAKAGGALLNFNCATVLIPVCRNMLSWLRTTPVNDILPLDDHIYFHKLCALGILVGAVLHVGCHHWNFWELLYNYQFGTPAHSYAAMMFGSHHNLTGYAILACMAPMFLTALECVRRRKRRCCGCCCQCFRRWCCGCACCQGSGHTLFFNVHKLWYVCIALLWVHGKSFWIYSLWPVIFALMEKVIQRSRGKQPVQVLRVVQHAADVIEVQMRLANDRKLRFTAGQYLYINCPLISEQEWHPFTLSSAPEDNFFSCHIRCRKDMDWTFALRTLLNPDGAPLVENYEIATLKDQKACLSSVLAAATDVPGAGGGKGKNRGRSTEGAAAVAGRTSQIELMENPLRSGGQPLQPIIRVDGPYGSASEEVFDFSTLMLVGAGIGVTPFASILRSLVARQRIAGRMPTVYFYWLCRSPQEFNSFKHLMQDTISRDRGLRKHFEFNLYMSGETDVTSDKFKRTLGEFQEWCHLYTGRPNWRRIFGEKKKAHGDGSRVGVFLCGPPAIAHQLDQQCRKFSDPKHHPGGGTRFVMHKENF